MKKIKLTESDLRNVVKKVMNEIEEVTPDDFRARKELTQDVIDRILKYGNEYVKMLKGINNKFPIESRYIGRLK